MVDDDGLVLGTIRAVLEDEGYTVDTAANVQQALERAIRHCPALVVLDMGLPPLTGDGVVAGLQAAYAEPIPVLLISADGHAAPEKAKRLAAFAYLVKPFDLDDLLALVQRGLSSS